MTNDRLNSSERAQEFFGRKLDFTISPAEVNEQIEIGLNNFIVDARAVKDFILGHVFKAVNLPFGRPCGIGICQTRSFGHGTGGWL